MIFFITNLISTIISIGDLHLMFLRLYTIDLWWRWFVIFNHFVQLQPAGFILILFLRFSKKYIWNNCLGNYFYVLHIETWSSFFPLHVYTFYHHINNFIITLSEWTKIRYKFWILSQAISVTFIFATNFHPIKNSVVFCFQTKKKKIVVVMNWWLTSSRSSFSRIKIIILLLKKFS